MHLLWNLFCLIFFLGDTSAEEIQLKIPFGTLIGQKLTTFGGFPYYSFQKVPYAEPPVGKLRFQAPIPIRNSPKVYNNTDGDIICYQTQANIPSDSTSMESEDCLFVNVYTPQLPSNRTNPLLPVLVYYFGGGFITGNPNKRILGPDFIIEENVIVVTVNYRTGPFGFLSTQDTVIPGNGGLKDQLLGLRWVNENIKYFGGDAAKITIGGESAGAASVGYLFLNKKTKGLFRGALAESGSALNQWSYQKNAKSVAFQLARRIDSNFTSTDSRKLLTFLEGLPAQEIKKAAVIMSVENTITQLVTAFLFGPVIEVDHADAFLSEKQYELMAKGDIHRVPLLTGISSEESLFLVLAEEIIGNFTEMLDKNPERILSVNMNLSPHTNPRKVGQEAKKIYTDGNFTGNIVATARCLSDILINRGVIKTANLLSKWVDVYFYQFSYAGTMIPMQPPDIHGLGRVSHVGEHTYLWVVTQGDFNNSDIWKFTESDRLTRNRVVKMFTNFVKYLNPSMTEDGKEVKWPTVKARGNQNFLYMNINVTLDVLNRPKYDTYTKWNDIYEKYAQRPYTTF